MLGARGWLDTRTAPADGPGSILRGIAVSDPGCGATTTCAGMLAVSGTGVGPAGEMPSAPSGVLDGAGLRSALVCRWLASKARGLRMPLYTFVSRATYVSVE